MGRSECTLRSSDVCVFYVKSIVKGIRKHLVVKARRYSDDEMAGLLAFWKSSLV